MRPLLSKVRVRLTLCGAAFALFTLGFDEPPAQPPGSQPLPHALDPDEPPYLNEVKEFIKPRPLAPIPDNPPPHEGAMIEIPYVLEPPDFVLVEVLEAWPGRPITGTRLIRPDGTITLGWYGDVYVKGLTLPQAKAKIVMHLRQFVNEEVLGLVEYSPDETFNGNANASMPAGAQEGNPLPFASSEPNVLPSIPGEDVPQPAQASSSTSGEAGRGLPAIKGAGHEHGDPRGGVQSIGTARPATPPVRGASSDPLRATVRGRSEACTDPAANAHSALAPPALAHQQSQAADFAVQLTRAQQESHPSGTSLAGTRAEVSPPGHQSLGITFEHPHAIHKELHPEERISDPSGAPRRWVLPQNTDRVYLDIDSYNSKHYYVSGDFANIGRYPCTGNDTVLDAVNFAAGFLPTADTKQLLLIRPGTEGKPGKVYNIDWEAIQKRGDPRANLQIFPGDRLHVERNAVVKTTVELNRVAEPISLVLGQIQTYLSVIRSLQTAANNEGQPLTAAEREAVMADLIDFWWKAIHPDGAKMDEKTFREGLNRRLHPAEPVKANVGEKDQKPVPF